MVGRCCCLRLASLTFIARDGFSTGTLARTLDSLVRVSRRVGKDHFGRIARSPSGSFVTDRNKGCPKAILLSLCDETTPSGLTTPHKLTPRAAEVYISTASVSTISGLLTLFPKCFSSFLHSTCSLSVSYLYLALEEVYLPLSAPVSRYTTLWADIRLKETLQTGLSPSLAVRSWTLLRLLLAMTSTLQITIRRTNARRLPVWAFPASVARTKGILVSFFSSA